MPYVPFYILRGHLLLVHSKNNLHFAIPFSFVRKTSAVADPV